MDLNRVTLIGTVMHAPESRVLPQGENVESFRLAVANGHDDAATNGQQKNVELLDLEASGKLGDIIAKYVRAGTKIYVEARLRSICGDLRIVVDEIIMLGYRGRREVALKPN